MLVDCKTLEFHSTIVQLSLIFRNDFDMGNPVILFRFNLPNPKPKTVADFFRVLESNEGPRFHLFYDDLPIYYVPARHKDRMYLMANLFTK